jgi:molybdopterin molybdotransferase
MLGIGRDSPDALYEMLERARLCDMVLTTGGVSMGDHDFMLEVFERWGVKREFWKVSMKPGKPVAFGMKGLKPVFGLPGNPVSAMVAFEQFVRPSIRKMLGYERLFRPVFAATLAPDAGEVRAKTGRTEFVRCRVERDGDDYRVVSVKKRGSGMLTTLVGANALMIIPAASEGVEPGGEVKVQLYDYELIEGTGPGW